MRSSSSPLAIWAAIGACLTMLAPQPAGAAAPSSGHAAPAAGPASDLVGKLDEVMPSLLAEYDVPGAAVAVIEKGRVAAIRTYGFADKAAGRPVTADTVFNVGSVSKTFSAWGVLRLASEKGLDIDAPVWRYVRSWRLPASRFDADRVSIRRLLSHTAGLSVHGYSGWTSLDERPTLLQSLSGTAKGTEPVVLEAEPGTRWSYSGGGYSVAQLLVGDQAGEPFAAYFDRDVFPAMGLTGTTFTVAPELLDRASRAYDEQGRLIPTRVFIEQAAAGLMTTITDMGRFAVLALHQGVAPAGGAVLPPKMFAQLTRPTPAAMPYDRFPDEARIFGLAEPKSGKHQGYGLGYDLYWLPDGREIVGHTGANIGWRAGFMVVPRTGQGIAVLTNADGGADVRSAIFCYWRRGLDGAIRPSDCPTPVATQLKTAYRRGGLDRLLAKFDSIRKSPAGGAMSDETLVEVAYGIASLAPDEAGARSPLADSVLLLEKNLKQYPRSAATLVGLAQLCAYTGDTSKAQAYARQALALDVMDSERADLEAILGK